MERRGFTLVEIVVAMALTLIVIGSIHRLLVTTQRLSRAQAAQVDLQSGVRAGAFVIARELRELNSTDILGGTANAMTYRAARGMGFLCQPPAAGQIRIAQSTFSGFRDPEPLRDAAYLFVEGNPDAALADAWVPLQVVSVGRDSCPGAVGSALTLTTSPGPPVADLPVGTPLRLYETMELRLYQSNGQWWLGARSVSVGEVIQPVIGPLAGSGGLRLEYLDRQGTPTTVPAAIKGVAVTIRGVAEDPALVVGGDRLEEELAAQVTLRNAVQR